MLNLVKVIPQANYWLHIFLSDGSWIEFNVQAEIERIPCYRPLYDLDLFNSVQFINRRVFWNEQYDFHLDQILERGQQLQD